jgi:hypothetical protein
MLESFGLGKGEQVVKEEEVQIQCKGQQEIGVYWLS